MTTFQLKSRYTANDLQDFADYVESLQGQIDFKVSSRGWCYILETERLINKNQFDKVEELINTCRRRGILPIDFTAEESSRQFSGVETPNENTIVEDFGEWITAALNAPDHFTPNWWEGEEYYIQMVVEKVDLVTLFSPVCNEFHIPIANAKGWSSMFQRAEYARRFLEAENMGLQPVLLYCGDHDPDGLRISDFIKRNLEDLKNVYWSGGMRGYDPEGLIIERFGLNHEFIERHRFTWIDNLITGSGKNLASANHKNNKMPYVQQYLKEFGERKVEANVIVTKPDAARALVQEAIEGYLGDEAVNRFAQKRQLVWEEFNDFLSKSDLDVAFNKAKRIIRDYRR